MSVKQSGKSSQQYVAADRYHGVPFTKFIIHLSVLGFDNVQCPVVAAAELGRWLLIRQDEAKNDKEELVRREGEGLSEITLES